MASSTTNSALQEHDQHLIRRSSSGRRKAAKVGCDSKKNNNKPPRRGMGVAKLERLRLQEEQPGLPLPFPEVVNASSCFPQMGPTPSFHGLTGSTHHHRLLQNHDSAGFLGKSSDVISGGFVKCFALHCNACHKKKKINDHRRNILGLEFGEKQHIINQESGNYGSKVEVEVEVVAVHRKGSSCGSWGRGNGGMLTEYDFFPPAKSEEGEMAVMKQQQQVGFLGSSSMAAASNCIDLSLKLSY